MRLLAIGKYSMVGGCIEDKHTVVVLYSMVGGPVEDKHTIVVLYSVRSGRASSTDMPSVICTEVENALLSLSCT